MFKVTNMIHFRLLILTILVYFSLCQIGLAAGSSMSVSPQMINTSLGDNFTIDIVVDPMDSEIYGVQYELHFNENILNATEQIKGPFLGQDGASTQNVVNDINNSLGWIKYGETRKGVENGVNTSGIVASITFEVIGYGTSDLIFTTAKLSNQTGGKVEAEVNNGSCIVEGSQSEEDSQSEIDLQVSDIKVKHNNHPKAWMSLSNYVNVTVVNSGAGNAGSFNVALYANNAEVNSTPISGLAAGANTTVSFNWIPEEAKTYELKAKADSDNAIVESNETNNELTISHEVQHNGYIGDKPLTTYAHDTITGDMIYTYGDSYYSSKQFPGATYTVNHSVTLPEGASVKFARLYNYWTWSYTGTTGKYPIMNLTFNGSPLSPEDQYDDRKGWGMYDYPTGTWAYNVTDLITGSGNYTTVVTNTDTDANGNFCIDGVGLLVVFENPNGQTIEYWINEGADMISTQSTSGGLTPEEATVSALFTGSINLNNVDSARLWTVVQSGGNEDNILLFNAQSWTGVYNGTPYPDLDVDAARVVKPYLVASDNTALIRSASPSTGGDYLTPSNAFLVITYSGTQVPALSLSASPTNVTVGEPTDVTFTVTNGSTPVEGADVNLTGSATGSGTTDANGTAVISVNATSEGTITATASKDGFASATTTLTAKLEKEGVSSSVSLSVDIIPVVALEVTPNNIDFGDLSPGDTSGAHTLTINNKGGYSISVTTEVTEAAGNLFVNGLYLDSAQWNSYSTTIGPTGSDTVNTSLQVPVDYIGIGEMAGTLIFWGQQT